jgi:hypothetical protein
MPDILTYHYDNARTGWNQSETQLAPSCFQSVAFGQVFQQMLDGRVYAQPLYAQNLQVKGALRNVVFVCTHVGSIFLGSARESDNLPERPAFSERWLLASLRG